jgi:hypothetical protein
VKIIAIANHKDKVQIVPFEEHLISQLTSQEALTRLLVEKGLFTKEEFLEIIKVVNQGIKRKRNSNNNDTSKSNPGIKIKDIGGQLLWKV